MRLGYQIGAKNKSWNGSLYDPKLDFCAFH